MLSAESINDVSTCVKENSKNNIPNMIFGKIESNDFLDASRIVLKYILSRKRSKS